MEDKRLICVHLRPELFFNKFLGKAFSRKDR